MTLAWLFPGQGSQSVGMANDVLAVSAAARAVFERADAALAPSWGDAPALSRLILEGPEDTLTLTANAQPAIVTTSCAILAAIRELAGDPADALEPAFAAGHSLGEYSALVAADALSLEDAVRVVRARGQAMQEAVPQGTGAMSAIIGLEPAKIEDLCRQAAEDAGREAGREQVVSPANFNAPGQIVVAGHAGAVARLGELVTAANGRAIALKVSAPFHCTLMAPAARVVEAALSGIAMKAPRVPIVANFDARPNRDAGRARELLVRQVDGPVRWEASLRLMVSEGVTHALEIGPGKVLADLAKRTVKELKVLSVRDAASLAQVPAFLAGASTRAVT
jgi:[acyl-carrier-protein] S-malonyltransferase